ncbi:hypothetical protein Dimus_007248, partial [Dionaea muscipula]
MVFIRISAACCSTSILSPAGLCSAMNEWERGAWRCGFGDDVCSLREELNLMGARPYGILALIGVEKGKGARPPDQELGLLSLFLSSAVTDAHHRATM